MAASIISGVTGELKKMTIKNAYDALRKAKMGHVDADIDDVALALKKRTALWHWGDHHRAPAEGEDSANEVTIVV